MPRRPGALRARPAASSRPDGPTGTARYSGDRRTTGDKARTAPRNRQGQAVQVTWQINCWANINRHGHGNEFHSHPGAFWSGSYYVTDGGAADDPALGGEFEVQDPRGVAPAMYAPNLTFAGPAGPSLGASEVIRPRAGMIVLFPSWLQHAVRPYSGPGERISIAFNLSIRER